jgi:hypothetical protein
VCPSERPAFEEGALRISLNCEDNPHKPIE